MIYVFENFSLDTDRRELRHEQTLVPIEPQVFDVLQFLLNNRERVVSNDDLIESVWNGRIVSEAVVATRMNAVRRALNDSGEKQRLIRTIARKGYRFVGNVEERNARRFDGAATLIQSSGTEETILRHPELAQTLAVPDKPSIAILPFANMSGDPEQEYFADGITEDLITALSQFRWFFVIARGSSFVYKGRNVDVKQVGQELGVRYVLEGSVRKVANRVRITGQLVDAATGVHLWGDRYDGAREDIFELQDRVTANVVGAIAPKLEQAEIERAKRKPTENLDAYDHFLRGMASVHQWTRAANGEAIQSFYKAIELDPNFASAYGMGARCYSQRKASGWPSDRQHDVSETDRLCDRAAELGRDVPLALCTAGLSVAYVVGKIDYGAALIDRSLELNPNLAWAWLFSGWVKILAGQPETAIEPVARAMRLSPQDPHFFNMRGVTSWACFFSGRYDEACSWAELAFRDKPNYVLADMIYPASKALNGQLDDAKEAMTRFLAHFPDQRISNLSELCPLRRVEDIARWAEGMKMAGLPE